MREAAARGAHAAIGHGPCGAVPASGRDPQVKNTTGSGAIFRPH
jgi:hypothetical protein